MATTSPQTARSPKRRNGCIPGANINFTGWAGGAWADWLSMLGLAGIAVALLLGVGQRIAAVSGTIMLLLG